MKISVYNPITRSHHTEDLPITLEQYERWKSGINIQVAMPNLNADQREFLISGTVPGDWDKIFTAEEKNNVPEKSEYFTEATIQFNVDNKPHEFIVVTNMLSLKLSVKDAVTSWSARTKKYTAESFCKYVIEKDANTICLTKQQYDELNLI